MKGGLFLIVVVLFLSCSTREETNDFSKKNAEKSVQVVLPALSQNKLVTKRLAALQRGHIFKTEKKYVPAELRIGNQTTAVKIRLKGDEIDHLESEKWSFRIKSKQNPIAGHKRFSLQNPATKNFLGEYLFHAFCKKAGLVALDYFFVPLTINDSLSKVYAYESVIDDRSIIDAGRKKGPILRFDENPYWEKMLTATGKIDSVSMLVAKIKPCNKKWCKKHKTTFKEGVGLLDNYRTGKISPSEAFDYDLFAKYVAISEVLGSSHNLRWINLRLYYNDSTKKLEPIAFDCFDGDHPRTTLVWYKEKQKFEYFLHPLFADEAFIELLEKYLREYAQIQYLKQLFNENYAALSKYNQLLKQEEPSCFFDRKPWMKRVKHIQKALEK